MRAAWTVLGVIAAFVTGVVCTLVASVFYVVSVGETAKRKRAKP